MNDYDKFVDAFVVFKDSKSSNKLSIFFEKIKDLECNEFRLYFFKALFLNKENRLDEAMENINKSVELTNSIHNNPLVFENNVFIYERIGNKSIPILNLRHIHEQLADVYSTAGEIYSKLNDFKTSLSFYVKTQYYLSFHKADFDSEKIELFSFRKFNQFTLSDLIENKITVSPSTAMNDPFDSLINLWATEEHLAMMCKEKSHAKPYAKSFQYNRIRCFCYGKEENVINKTLMWAHYAEEHRGICIKYQLSSHFIKQDENDKYEHMYLKKVEYTDKTISIETPTINSAIAFATKGKEWSYENEVRLIDYNPNIETPYYGIALDKESYIESIYFGFRCEDSTINTIKALFKNHDTIPKFYKMELDRSNVYRMICKEL